MPVRRVPKNIELQTFRHSVSHVIQTQQRSRVCRHMHSAARQHMDLQNKGQIGASLSRKMLLIFLCMNQ